MKKTKNDLKWSQLRERLEKTEREFVSRGEIFNDALEPALPFKNPQDRECVAFICALFAYGAVEQIKKSVHRLLTPLGSEPVTCLISSDSKTIRRMTQNWFHRFNTSEDAAILLEFLKHCYFRSKNLCQSFKITEGMPAFDMIEAIRTSVEDFVELHHLNPKPSFWYLFPKPSNGSACKRMNLFLRWMIGRSPMDLSLWDHISPEHLVIPLDTHILKQSHSLGLCTLKSASWKAATQITETLRKLDAKDPTRFDFALCHLGMNGILLKN